MVGMTRPFGGAFLAMALASSLGVGDDIFALSNPHRDYRSVTRAWPLRSGLKKSSASPTDKRAKVKAARKANLRRIARMSL